MPKTISQSEHIHNYDDITARLELYDVLKKDQMTLHQVVRYQQMRYMQGSPKNLKDIFTLTPHHQSWGVFVFKNVNYDRIIHNILPKYI